MYEIEKDIPMPVRTNIGRKRKYNWKDMQVGDCFFVPLDGREFTGLKPSIYGSATRFYKKSGTVSCFLETKDGVDGIRVWRVK